MDPLEAIRRAEKLLQSLIDRRGSIGDTADEIMILLRTIETELSGQQERAFVRPAKKGSSPVQYQVEQISDTEVLTERRLAGTSQPFRCGQSIYDALVKVMTNAESPMSIEDIAEAMKAETGIAAADFQLRVPIRLWLHVKPALILRHRSRYRAADPATFSAQSKRLWNRLNTDRRSHSA